MSKFENAIIYNVLLLKQRRKVLNILCINVPRKLNIFCTTYRISETLINSYDSRCARRVKIRIKSFRLTTSRFQIYGRQTKFLLRYEYVSVYNSKFVFASTEKQSSYYFQRLVLDHFCSDLFPHLSFHDRRRYHPRLFEHPEWYKCFVGFGLLLTKTLVKMVDALQLLGLSQSVVVIYKKKNVENGNNPSQAV